MYTVKSPLIPTSNARLVEKYSVDNLVNEWKSLFDIDITNELKGLDEIFLYRCEESHLDFFLPSSAAGTSNLYHALQKFDWFYSREKWEFDEAIKDLAGCINVLDVGCGEGFFIEKAFKTLQLESIRGIELNEVAVEKAIKKNLHVDRLSLKHLIDKGETFDAVCGFQILEHLNDPLTYLEDMIKLLAHNGKLILSVPNKESFLKHQHNLLDMPPHHMTKWSLDTFKYLEKLFSLKLMRFNFEPLAKTHIPGYVNTYAQHLCSKIFPRTLSPSNYILRGISALLEKTTLHRFLRGQSLYVMYQKP
ncbi:MAG: class I SAM-dependent methyltransferase [Nitrospirota bacterium]